MSLDQVASSSLTPFPSALQQRRRRLHPPHSASQPRQTAVEDAIAQVFGVAHADLSCPSRGRANVALARQVAMYLTHVVCGFTLTEVGMLFGRDRTTVAHACAVVEDRRDNPAFDRALDLLEWALPTLLNPSARFEEPLA